MSHGIWTAASGASAQAQSLDSVANNLANVDTPAFKKDIPTFKEYLSAVEREHQTVDIPRGPIRDRDFYPLDGRDQSSVILDGTHTQHEQGNLRVTQRTFDFALDGPGFFEVSTPVGIRYTRAGSFKVGPDGRLLTSQGYPVLAAQATGLATGNSDVASRMIHLEDQGSRFTVSDVGEIYSGNNRIARLSLVEFRDLKKITKSGGAFFENKASENLLPPQHTQVKQGMIETSNVNPIHEMSQLIRGNRLFEHNLKALKTYGELLAKESNEVGKL